jgi:NTE family protein
LHDDDADRTVFVDSFDVSATDFDISEEMKQKLIESGKASTEE